MNIKRYLRQTTLSEVGTHGQNRLKKSRVLCVGLGGLGSPATLYLAAAGVGKLGLIDDDRVDESNLQRQILFSQSEQGIQKVDAAAKRLKELNPDVSLHSIRDRFTEKNADELLKQYDLILDGSDNFNTKFLINDAAHKHNLPWVYGAVNQFEGQVAYFQSTSHGPCYRCLYPSFPKSQIQNCAETGVLGSVVGIIGSMQATLALQYLISGNEPQHILRPKPGQLSIFDFSGAWNISTLEIPKKATCPTCSRSPHEIKLAPSAETACNLKNTPLISAQNLKEMLLNSNESTLLIDVRSQSEWDEEKIINAIHWPLLRIEKGDFPSIPNSKSKIIVYCKTGKRSALAAQILNQYSDNPTYLSLEGGIDSWKEMHPTSQKFST